MTRTRLFSERSMNDKRGHQATERDMRDSFA